MSHVSTLWRPHDTHAHPVRTFALHAFTLTVFAAFAISWPGAVLLSVLYIIAGYAAVIAGISLHAVCLRERRTWTLHWLGGAFVLLGAALMIYAHGAVALAPAIFAAWLVTRARDGWTLTHSTLLLAFSLLLLSGFGDHPARTLALIGVHALTTGTLLAGLAPRPAAAPVRRFT